MRKRPRAVAWKRVSAVVILSLFLTTLVVFRKFVLWGMVPIAFDYGVVTYEPWKIDYAPTFTDSPPQMGHDDIRIFYPQRQFTTSLLRETTIPHWNPYAFSGNVSQANSQTATFYPPFLFFLLLPQRLAWSWLAMASVLLAAIGTFLFLRELLGSQAAAGFGALVFAFSSAMLVRSQDGLVAGHSIIWLPWVLLAMEWVLTKRIGRGVLIGILSLVFSMLAGWFQFTFYVYFLGILYAAVRWRQVRGSVVQGSIILGLYLTSVLLTAFHWLPAFEALRFSPRGRLGTPPEFISEHLMPITYLATLIIPNFFGHPRDGNYYGTSEYKEGLLAIGLPAFLLALVGMRRVKDGKQLFFLGVLLGSLLMALKTPVAEAFLALKLPLISTFLPNRAMFVATFSLSMLAAFGFSKVMQGELSPLRRYSALFLRIFLAFYVLVTLTYIYEKLIVFPTADRSLFELGYESYLSLSVTESLLPFVLLLLFTFGLRQLRGHLLLVVLVVLTFADIVVRANRDLYFSDPKHEFPPSPIFNFLRERSAVATPRFLTLSYSKITSNIPTYFKLYDPEGVDAMYPIWYAQFSGFFQGKGKRVEAFSRIETFFSEAVVRRGWNDPATLNLLSHLGVRYLVVPRDYHDLPRGDAFREVFGQQWHTVYEYTYATPRAYFVSNGRLSDFTNLTLQRIFHPEFLDADEVVLSRDAGEPTVRDTSFTNTRFRNNQDLDNIFSIRKTFLEYDPFYYARRHNRRVTRNPVEFKEYTPNRVSLQVKAPRDGYVVLSDTYFPGWEAKVDGIPTLLWRANHAFRAVQVEAGDHTIVMEYNPRQFRRGLQIASLTLGSLMLGAGWLLISRKGLIR